jgi:serine phosphatase RsbU (regulator of sigma subunit)
MAAEIGVVSALRSHPYETVSGDACLVTENGGSTRIALIDGLGHGIGAAEAAEAACEVLRDQPQLKPLEALLACHESLRRTRGAALSIAQVSDGRLLYCGVGNVEARLVGDTARERLYNTRGIVGGTLARPKLIELDLPERWLLVMHSDGVSQRLEVQRELLDELDEARTQRLADDILATWGRDLDDALVVVAWPRQIGS